MSITATQTGSGWDVDGPAQAQAFRIVYNNDLLPWPDAATLEAAHPALSNPGASALVGPSLAEARVWDVSAGVWGERSPSSTRMLRSHARVFGQEATASISNATMHLTMNAPAHYDAVQLILRGRANSESNAFKASIAPSAKRGNGYVPVDAADNALTFTPVTFGLTDRNDFRNRGGGASTTLIQNVVGDPATASANFFAGDVPSDWMSVKSLDRADSPTSLPLLMIRLQGVGVQGTAALEAYSDNANPWTSVMPDHYSGYWISQDYTATANPGSAPTQWGIPDVSVVFLLRGTPIKTLAVTGDSLDQGWVQPQAVPQFGGNINGWGRRFVELLRSAGKPTGFADLTRAGHHSIRFHNRVMQAIEGGGITHIAFKPWSINESDTGNVANAYNSIRRTNMLIELAQRNRVRPIVVRNWAGQGSSSSPVRSTVDAFVDGLPAQGIAVFDARSIIQEPGKDELKTEYLTRDSGGAIVETTHLNDAAYSAIASYAFSLRYSVFDL